MLNLNDTFGKTKFDKAHYEALLPFMPESHISWGAKISLITVNGVAVYCIRMSADDYRKDLLENLAQQGFEEADIDYSDERITQRNSELEFYSRGSMIISIEIIYTSAFEDNELILFIEQI